MIRFNKYNFPEFSNFWPTPIEVNGKKYMDVEAAFQAGKQKDGVEDVRFYSVSKGEAKKLGRKVDMRSDWEKIKYKRMLDCVYAKFTQYPELAEKLLSTGYDWIVEDTTAWHDNIWGACRCANCVDKPSTNLMGQALMGVRAILRGEKGVLIQLDYKEKDVQCDFDLYDEDVTRMKEEGTWAHTLNLLKRVEK